MLSSALVDVLQQGRQSGGLARAGGTGHQHQPAGPLADFPHHLWQAQLLQAGDTAAQGPQAGGVAALLAVDVDAEAGHPLEPVGAVQLPGLLQLLALVVVQQAENQAIAAFFAEGVLMHGLQGTAETAIGRQSG